MVISKIMEPKTDEIKKKRKRPDGERDELRRVRCNSQSTCSLQSRHPILAPGTQAGIFRHKKLWHNLCAKLQPVGIGPPRSQGLWFSSSFTHSKQSTLRQRIRHVAGGSGRRKLARVLREQRMASPRLVSISAMARGWQAAALGQSNEDVAATLAGSAQSQCQAACRPGGYGRAIAKAFTRRGRQCVQDIQALRRFGSRLHQPQGNFAVASRFASAFHRPAHGVRGKVDQRC